MTEVIIGFTIGIVYFTLVSRLAYGKWIWWALKEDPLSTRRKQKPL